MTTAAPAVAARPTSARSAAAGRPPLWLVIATGAMAVILLAMSVGETSLRGQYLIDQGEYISLVGLAFILIAGLALHRRHRLVASLPLVLPWLLYPVITQGDQIIDNLSITWMRIIVHVLLAAIFAMPVAVIVYAARSMLQLSRRASLNLTRGLLLLEMALAYAFLGALMLATLLVMIAAAWYFGTRDPSSVGPSHRREALALWMLIGGVAVSGALYLGFKNRPGAYQGSPSFYMDPSQPGGGFQSATAVPSGSIDLPSDSGTLQLALTTYAASLQKMLDAYYMLDRNYNYHFHNELFVRSTPLLPNYRSAGLALIDEARALQAAADAAAARVVLADDNPLQALLADVRGYVAFNAARAATLERLSGEFETTKAGLQHATHLYEGEGKYLGVQLDSLMRKHQQVLRAPEMQFMVSDFVVAGRAVHEKYSNRIVGF